VGEIHSTTIEDLMEKSTGVEFVETAERSGLLLSAILHWPRGSEGYLEISLFHNGEPILPKKGGVIALDDTTQSFPINRPVEVNDELLLRVENADGANDHRFSATLLLEVE